MAVQAPATSRMNNFDDGDDDGPIVFRRNSAIPKKTQLISDVKKSSSSSAQPSNGKNSSAQKGKTTVPSATASPVKSPIGSPKPLLVKSPSRSPNQLTSSAKASPVKLPVANSKSSSVSNTSIKEENHSIKKEGSIKEENHSIKKELNDDDGDFDDHKLLIDRHKGNSDNSNKVPGAAAPNTVKSCPDDSEDDVPLIVRFQMKSNAGTSESSKPIASDERKPLASKSQQNGSTARDSQQKSSMLSRKRPLEMGNSSHQTAVKKPKLSDSKQHVKLTTIKAERKDADDDSMPISQRMKKSASSDSKSLSTKQKLTKVSSSSKKITKKNKKTMKNSKYSKSTKVHPTSGDGQKKWTTLVHSGVIFPPPYQPHGIKILYKGRPVDLTPGQEEVATMFAVMKETDYMQKPKFLENFWIDWRKLLGKNHVIQKLEDCDFKPIYDWHLREKEKKKQMSTEEKKALKEEKLKQEEKYMWAIVDGIKEKVGNFRVEPPGLFRGRGEHPKMGKLKRRIRPNDITINIGEDAPIPECPIQGESWKEVKHDNTVTWLAFWNDPINPKEFKYVFLAASSSLKGQSDKEKYEKARKLKDFIKNIRAAYTKDFTSKDITKRQIAVATYLIDKLALRAGNEKDDDEADTVGCCTLKVGNVECIPPNSLKFDFLGKDSIQYVNTVEVEVPVYKAIGQFQTGKRKTDDLFDKLDTSKLNAHLKELMPGLTAKVFRTYNASITLDEMLSKETKDGDVAEKVLVYQHANKEVAIICNHQRTISKTHGAQMTKLTEKIEETKGLIKELKTDLDRAKKGKPPLKDADGKQKRSLTPEAIERKIAQTNSKIEKMERDMQSKEDLKTVALGTSKINYLDPRITVAWCKRHEVPIEKIFNKSLLAKFAWSMDVDPEFRF
ncbi:Topoisom_I domain-containing protein/Topoisom_I_N domain-containing protein/Topo_C_assoc domain-containing protein [Cephalotus follicularis]|uniref:DNA topoisomerase I n=1 Tax=Cephalotus follicularis TaxID=3775 RepID=A0A1Q3D4N1_CEPFO|nr:Topoisom_I domain-containing protein/Topoisom_I_N domain-containing protein/Topo_C_assoc domain-containing protein [Cephalotus follicularis]